MCPGSFSKFDQWKCAGNAFVAPVRGLRAILGLVLALASVAVTGCNAFRQERSEMHTRRGDELVRRGGSRDLQAAIDEFQQAAKLAPQRAQPYSRLGTVYRRLGEYERAIQAFVEAVRRDPNSFEDTFSLGQLYFFSKRMREAIQAYLHAVELAPQDADAQLNLGVCYHQSGDFDQAIQRFEKAIEVDPGRSQAYVNLGVSFDAQGRYHEAVRAYKDALERDSHLAGQPIIYVNLAQTYMNQDRLKMARQTLARAIELDGALPTAHEAMGYCLFRLREFDEAASAYETALALDARLPRAHAGLGSVCMLRYLEDPSRNSQRDLALEHWHRSLEADPHQPRIRKLIAQYSPESTDPELRLLSGSAGGAVP